MPTLDRSTLQRHSGDVRLLNTAGWALALQVSHPTVGAGVREHSNFKEDPWGRLMRTLDFTTLLVYGEPKAAVNTGRNVREMHKRIKGVKPDGSRYSALEPDAYAWVHATLIEGIVLGHTRFIAPLSRPTIECMYAEWRELGRLLGVRDSDLPPDWNGFRVYFDRTVAERLEDNDVVHDVLELMSQPTPPPIPLLAKPAFRLARRPLARIQALATSGLLPPLLRERLGLRWTRAQELELSALAAASRAAGPLLPAVAKDFGPSYLKWREEAIDRGGMAAAPDRDARLESAA